MLPLGLLACAPADLPARMQAPAAGAPDLLPLDQVRAQRTPGAAPETEAELRARADRLRARAAALADPVLTPADRRRLADRVGG